MAVELKTRASEAFAKGKFAKAAELYAEYCDKAPKDVQSRLRMGDAWAKAGNKPKAISAYSAAAESFAKEGFLPRAIAASKLILELDPSHKGVQTMLADLYSKKAGGKAPPRPAPEVAKVAAPLAAPATDEQGNKLELPPELTLGTETPLAGDPVVDLVAKKTLEPADTAALPPTELGEEEGLELELTEEVDSAAASSAKTPPTEQAQVPAEALDEADVLSTEPAPQPPDDMLAPRTQALPPAEQAARETSHHVDRALGSDAADEHAELPGAPAAASEEAIGESLAEPRDAVLSEGPRTSAALELEISLAPEEVEQSVPQPLRPSGPAGLRAKGGAPHVTPDPWPMAESTVDGELSERLGARFDELSLDDAGVQEPAAPVLLGTAQAPARLPEPKRSFEMSQFTELELDVDSSESILAAVERAAEHANDSAGATEEPVEPAAEPSEAAFPELPLFSDLPRDAFIALFERCPLKRCVKGERILTQGEPGKAFYVICEGSVRVFREEADGGERHLALLQHGAFFGEMALLSGAPRTASVEAASDDTQLLEISAQVLAPLARSYPAVAKALRKFCRQRLLANVMDTAKIFQPFSRADRRGLVERFRARDVKPGDVLITEGERSDGLYVILSGEVEALKADRVLARLKEGELFGEMSLLTKSAATAQVRATKRTSVLRLPREDFDALVLSHPQVLELVAELTAGRGASNAHLLI